MIKVYHELNPEIKLSFEESYNNFFYDQGGLFVRGYWAVLTLGTAQKIKHQWSYGSYGRDGWYPR